MGSQLHTIPYILLNITEIPLILSISIISLISVIPCNIDNIFEGKTQLIVTVGSLEYIWEFLLSVRGHPAYTPFLLSVIIVVLNIIIISLAINNWLRDIIRENIKKNRILYKLLLISLISFIFSELFLFISYFWIYFHNYQSMILISDPCKLTYVNIILLSIISINISILYYNVTIII